ncbi:hypothetical protein BME96_19040 (plasmid) [Virgibacillus halodenitrificans]|uniref:Lipoprotein n=1 Tax=Virgibacillus halodenitrificans TaxID=1482 RepID=A0AAC9NMP0_VIRHA|nr:hypothetical protein [Virgibacillus halodenitrificans]APC50380.1 hypothetical protein BME96_19040 [Virgibacillus halodenitrificans]
MLQNKKKIIGLLAGLSIIAVGCGVNSENESKVLEEGKVYDGKNATHEIIEVESGSNWTVKSDKKDDSNYSVVTVDDTGEEIAGYHVINIKAEEVNGDIESSFAKREGRDFIIVSDEESVYFRSVAEENKSEIEEALKNTDNPDQHVKDISNYIFNES